MLSETGAPQSTNSAGRSRTLSFEEQKRAASTDRTVHGTKPLSTFREFWALGYRRLLPVIPPKAEISPRSLIFKRVGTPQDSRGKAVGYKGRDGLWRGFDWLPYEADEDDLRRWQADQASVGIKCGKSLVAIDSDTLDPKLAGTIEEKVQQYFVSAPVRFGRRPKALYLIRVTKPVRYMHIGFGELNEKGRPRERIEVLSEGKQFVAAGQHPGTGKAYEWPNGLPHFDRLPVCSPDLLKRFLAELRDLLPNAAPLTIEGSSSDATVDQASLRGELDKVRKAVELIPNSGDTFASRDAYLNIGYAVKAALPDNPEEAFDVFREWCERWTDGENDPAIVEADWQRMRGPYRRGASWLYELAERHAPEQFSRAEVWFKPIGPSETSVFDVAAKSDHAPGGAKTIELRPTLYAFPDPSRIPRRQWLYGDHYIRGFVSATVAPGGVGKSSLTIVEALAMASGKPLLGVEPKGRFRVWLWNGEDPRDELERRIAAAIMHYGLSPRDVGNRLLVDTGVEQEIVLAREAHGDAKIVEPMSAAIVSAVRSLGVDAMIVDPFVSTHKVSENDNGAIDLVVKRWGKIADQCQIAVELVHHVRKSNGAEVTVEDARGASAMINAARATRALTRMTEAEGRKLGVLDYWRYFRFGGVTKSNLAPAAAAPATAPTGSRSNPRRWVTGREAASTPFLAETRSVS